MQIRLNNILNYFSNERRTQKGYFYRLFWIGCMSAFIPVILIGGLYYYFATTSLKDQIKKDSEASLVLFKERVESILQSIELESHQLASNPVIRDSFSTPQFSQKISAQLDLLQQLKLSKLNNNMIEEVYYYNTIDNFVLSNEYGYISKEAFKYQRDIEKIIEENQRTAWLRLPIASKQGYISLARKLPILESGKPKGLLVILVKEKVFLDYFPSNNQQLSFVLDHQNKGLFLDNKTLSSIKHKHESALNRIIDEHSNSGVFYDEDKSQHRTLYIYNGRSTLGRVYISLVPESAITKELSLFRWMIFTSAFVILCIGMLFTIIYARRAYNPIKQLVDFSQSLGEMDISTNLKNEITIIQDSIQHLSKEKQKLRKYKEEIEPTLREWFFQQILEGKYVIDHFLYKKCKEYNIPIQSQYVVIAIDDVNLMTEDDAENDDKHVSLVVVKSILNELFQNDPSLEAVDVNTIQDNVTIIFRYKEDMSSEEIKDKLYNTSLMITDSLQKRLFADFSIGVGRIYPDIKYICNSFEEALLALQYRIYKDSDTVLFIEDVEQSKKKGMFFYPRDLDARIVESLKVGDLDLAQLALHDFSKSTSLFKSYNSTLQCFYLLLTSIIFSLEKQGQSIKDIFEPDLFSQLKSLKTLEEINKWFIEYLFPFYESFSEETDTSSGTLAVKQICQYINENISQDITLTQCAELVNLTPSYLSRLFKKEVGVNFREYVLIRKVEKAKSLCLQTDVRASEIAEAVGYSERNLTRLFVKYVDMTISQYRNSNR